jgi:hypothetical protein
MIFIFDQFDPVLGLYPDLGTTAQWLVRRIDHPGRFPAVLVIDHCLVGIVIGPVGLTGQDGLSLATGAVASDLVLIDVYDGLHRVYMRT